ncbi:MAG: tetratricopeptide repeat protein [Treponema sp.]|nr:tetratricopeptide repeat protein [Treponema sp.]
MKDNLRKTLCMAFAALVLSGSAFSADVKKTKADREAARERERERIERKAAADRQDAYEEAVEAFQLNKPAEAIPLLEAFLGDEKHGAYNPDVYVYLSAAYYQIEEYQKSIDVCELGLSKEGTNYKVLYFNEGNAAYALGQYMKAASLYEKSRGVDSQYAPATLNLANAFLRQDKIEEARDDYVLYLELKPDTPQRPEIERLIALLNEEIDYRKRLGPELVQDLLRTSADDGSEGPHELMSDSEAAAPGLPLERVNKYSGEQLDTSESQAPALPVERRKQNSGEQLDSSESQAPALPVERRKRNSGEQVNSSDSQAPSLPKSGDSKRKGEYIDNPSAPALPEESKAEAKKEERMSTSDTVAPKMPEEKKKSAGEKIKDNAPALPKEKKDERLERIKNQDAPKLPAEENEAVVSEEKNSASESASSVDAK